MTAPDVLRETSSPSPPQGASPTRLLASALLHALERDEAPPAMWRAEAFVLAVAQNRADLAGLSATADLDLVATPRFDPTFHGAVEALGSDPLAAALAVRRLELTRQMRLPTWPAIVGRGIGPRVSHADTSRWFG